MKQYINKFACALGACVWLVACSQKDEAPKKVAEVTETVVVEETVLPSTAEKLNEEKPAETKPAPQPVAAAKTLYPGEVLTQLKAWDKKLQFLKTRFEQTTQYDGVPVSQSQGMLYYDRDKNMLRLDTTNTDGKTEQSAVTDKKQILILDGQGHEITTLAWDEWQQGQPNQALFDFGNYTALLARHNAVLKEPYLLELTPKEGEKYTLYLMLSEKDYFPTHIKISSDLMQTEAVLTDTQKNEPLDFDTFRQGGLFK